VATAKNALCAGELVETLTSTTAGKRPDAREAQAISPSQTATAATMQFDLPAGAHGYSSGGHVGHAERSCAAIQIQ